MEGPRLLLQIRSYFSGEITRQLTHFLSALVPCSVLAWFLSQREQSQRTKLREREQREGRKDGKRASRKEERKKESWERVWLNRSAVEKRSSPLAVPVAIFNIYRDPVAFISSARSFRPRVLSPLFPVSLFRNRRNNRKSIDARTDYTVLQTARARASLFSRVFRKGSLSRLAPSVGRALITDPFHIPVSYPFFFYPRIRANS